MKKYKFIKNDTKIFFGTTITRIKALKDFGYIKKGDLGGYIENENNLSQYSEAWVSGKAQVYGEARVYGKAQISGEAWVYGEAQVYGKAQISGEAWVYGKAQVYDKAWVSGKAQISGEAQVSDEAQISGEAQVSGKSQVSDEAWVSGKAQVYGEARVYGKAQVYGEAQVYGKAWVSKFNLINIIGLGFNITISDYHIQIGCGLKTISEWKHTTLKNVKDNYPVELNWWKAYKDILFQLADNRK